MKTRTPAISPISGLAALAMALCAVLPTRVAPAAFQMFFDKPGWESAVSTYTALTFADLGGPTHVTNQYAHLGVTFLNGDDVAEFGPWTYPQDGWGIDANANCHLKFDFDIYAIGVWHPGNMALKLYNDGQLVFSFPFFPGGGTNWFGGVVSTVPFDEVIIYDFFDPQINIDDIYFAAIPAPPVWLAMVGGLMVGGRRRRA